MQMLQTPTALVRAADGAMRPLVDPLSIAAVLRDVALNEAHRLGILWPDGSIGPPQPEAAKPN